MPHDDICLEAEERMDKAVQVFVEQVRGIRTGRASPALVENIKVDYYGSPTPLKQIAAISVPDARLLVIRPYDPGALGEIEKALQKSELGLNPANDGKVVRLPIPPLSEERRQQLAKQLKGMGEQAKVAVRNVRRDAMKTAEAEEKDKKITEDEKFKIKDSLQKFTEEYEKKTDEGLEKKTKEILEG